MTTIEERVIQLEGIFQQFAVVVGNMVTREELRAAIETSEKRLLAEQGRLAAEQKRMMAELRAEIRGFANRIIKWNVATIIASVAVAVAAIKLLP